MKRIFDKKGVTLIELLVAMAILSIVLVMVGSFMVTGTNLFSSENSKAKTQNEVQLTLNRVSDILKASQLGVSYSTETGNLEEFCISDPGDDVDAKYLYVFNWDDSSVKICADVIKWVKEDAKMYLAAGVLIGNNDEVIEMGIAEAVGESNVKWELLAEHIDGFSVDLSDYELKKTVDITLSSKRQKGKYENTLTTSLRNNVLLNASSVGELYDLAERAITTVVKEISLTAARNSTIPGGQIQLSTFVSGEGYPSQRIYKWKIVRVSGGDETEVIYDSLEMTSSDTNVSASGKVLNVSENMDATILRVYAYANTYSGNLEYVLSNATSKDKIEEVRTAGGGVSTILLYDYTDISVRDITSFAIKPNPDLTIPENESLNVLDNTFAEVFTRTPENMPEPGVMDVYPGNIIPIKATVSGTYLSQEDKEVYWTIDSQTANTDVMLDVDGTLVIGKYSADGQILISCHSVLDSRMCLSYYVNIGDAFAEGNNMLEIVGPSSVNRGGSAQLGLKLNENDVKQIDLSNFNWNFEVVNSDNERVPGGPATLSETGLLTVSAGVNYDYAYNINLTVSMKNNPSIRATKRIAIPRVKVTLSSDSYVSKRGRTIDYGEITANVEGVEKSCYTLSWDMASETNPNHFEASYANGTYITGNSNNSCKIFISGSEPESLTYFRARVKINGHATHFAFTRIVLADVTFSVTSDRSEISRSDGSSYVTFTATSPQTAIFAASEMRWEIASAKIGSTEVSKDGLVLTMTAGGARLYAKTNFYPSTETVQVTVKGVWSGIEKEKTISVKPVDFKISGPTNIERGGTADFNVNDTFGNNIEWSVSASDGSSYAFVTRSGAQYANASVSLGAGFSGTNTTSDELTVTATVSGTTLSAKYTLKITPVKLTITSLGSNKYKATLTGTTATDYVWSLKANATGGSVSGVTISSSGDTATLTINSSAPTTFYLCAKAVKGGTDIGKAQGEMKVSKYSFESNPSAISYSSTSYVCEYNRKSSNKGYYYANAIRGNKSGRTINGVDYWRTQEGTRSKANGSITYSRTYVYYARVDGTWYTFSGSAWTETDSTVSNRLNKMIQNQNIG